MDGETVALMKSLLLCNTDVSSFHKDSHEGHLYSKYLQFSSRLKNLNKEHLSQYFLELDSNRTTTKNVKSQYVAEKVGNLMNAVAQEICEIDERFKCKVIPSGSYFDELKIDNPDEFDFVFEIEAFSKPEICKIIGSTENIGKAYTLILDDIVADRFVQFLHLPEEENAFLKGMKTIEAERLLSASKINDYFHVLVSEALQHVKTKKEVFDGEITGPLNHGPCAMIYIEFASCFDVQFRIDVDVAPGIRVAEKAIAPPVLQKQFTCEINENFTKLISRVVDDGDILLVPFIFDSIEQTHMSCWKHNYSETWRISFQNIERNIIQTYSHDSTEKRVIRILKMLLKDHFKETKEVADNSDVNDIIADEPPSTFITNATITPLFGKDGDGNEDDDFEHDDNDYYYHGNDIDDEETNENTVKINEVLDKPTCVLQHISQINFLPLLQSGEKGAVSNRYIEPNNDFAMEKSLLKSYSVKMLFLFSKLSLRGNKSWSKENLVDIILLILDALYYAYSSKRNGFQHFWFQTYVGQPTKDSTRLEILYCLDELSRWACSHFLDVKM